MKKFLIFIPILLISTLSCLDPDRDNPYDPENPDMVYVGGIVYGINYQPVEGATIKLIQDSIVVAETQSEVTGWYEFTDVTPDRYRLVAEAELYTSLNIHPVELPAGSRNDTFDLYFHEIFFDFESDLLGPTPPRGFLIESGQWEIVQDNTGSGMHSIPNVFRGTNEQGTDPFAMAVFIEPVKNFWVDAKFKYLGSSNGEGAAGLVLRGQDKQNYYLLALNNNALIFRVVRGDTQCIPLASDSSYQLIPDMWICLAADFEDSDIGIYLNETLVFQLQDNTFDQGFVGLWVKSLEAGGEAIVHCDDMGISW